MSDVDLPALLPRGPARRALTAELALGAAYWAAFLLTLEPGNALHAMGVGHPLSLAPETARIAGASLLGAASTPVVLALVRRFPIAEGRPWRNGAVQAASVAGLTGGLIFVSCLLAGLGNFGGSTDVPGQLAENGPLVAFCLAGLTAVANALHFRRQESRKARADWPAPAHPFLAEIAAKTRSGVLVVPLDEVDWIETQGNYLALHVGSTVHLIRETLARLEQQLDPRRFARVHRCTLVSLDRIRELKPLGGGDAELRLADGTRLRLSRSYRDPVQARLQAISPRRSRP